MHLIFKGISMDFKVGQKVMLIDNGGMNALLGTIATVYKVDFQYVYVKWEKNNSYQNDGAYNPYHFKIISQLGQLTFSFYKQL